MWRLDMLGKIWICSSCACGTAGECAICVTRYPEYERIYTLYTDVYTVVGVESCVALNLVFLPGERLAR